MERRKRTVEYSETECTHVLMHEDINGAGRLFGGKLLSWIDETGVFVARRHSGMQVTTAAIDNLQFLRGAALDDLVVLIGRLTYVGNTSMEVRVDSYIEDREGMRHPINRAYIIYVAVDDEGRPVTVPYDLEIRTETQKIEREGALLRKQNRRERRLQGF